MIQKRGQSKIITVVLLILLIIVLIIVLWNIIIGLLKETQYKIGIEQEISKIKLKIEDANCINENGQEVNCTSELADNVSLAIQRSGSGQVIIGHENVTRNRTITSTEIITRPVDIIFVIDTTGSMEDEIQDVKNTITTFVDNINININAANNETNKFGLIDYKDYPITGCGGGDDYPSRIHLFNGNKTTENVTIFKNEVNTLSASGSGGDTPESHLTALNETINLPYRYKKVVVLLSDAPPHAKDCECKPNIPPLLNTTYSFCTYYINDSNNDGKNDTYQASSSGQPNCYQGPETIEEIKQQLIIDNISFYYINKKADMYQSIVNYSIVNTCFNEKDKQMADELGRFYLYNESGGATSVDGILISISNDIDIPKQENYTEIVEVIQDEEEWNKLIIKLYNDEGDSCSIEIPSAQVPFKPPRIGETINYNIPLCDYVDGSSSKVFKDPTFLRIFFVLPPPYDKETLLTEQCLVPGAEQCE